jgi:lipid A disaccharide synthetase
MARSLLRWLARPAERQEFHANVRTLRQKCGRPGVWERTAQAVLDMLPPKPGVVRDEVSGNGG